MTHKLLLADDSITIQRVIELTFSGEDVDVVAVSDGEQAIARIATERPDIILADIGMPKRSGYEVAAFVKGHPDLSHIPVLLLAGAFEPVDEARATQVRCDGVLVKPFEPQHVIARVRELIGRTQRSAPGEAPAPVQPPLVATPAPPVAPTAHQLPVGAVPDPSLDDYFNRLDAAFATLGQSHSRSDDATATYGGDTFRGRDVPTIDDVLAGASLRPPPGAPVSHFGRVTPPPTEPPETTSTLAPASRPQPRIQDGSSNVIADVFHLLFAVEQGEAEPGTVRVGAPAASVPITDELVEEITRRVLERLAPGAVRDRVAEVVSEVAERLVREEITRIRGSKA